MNTTANAISVAEALKQIDAVKPILPPQAMKTIEQAIERRNLYTPDFIQMLETLRDQIDDYIRNIKAVHARNMAIAAHQKAAQNE